MYSMLQPGQNITTYAYVLYVHYMAYYTIAVSIRSFLAKLQLGIARMIAERICSSAMAQPFGVSLVVPVATPNFRSATKRNRYVVMLQASTMYTILYMQY